MLRWKLKSCPRCSGDLFIYQDIDSWYEQCLQCCYWHESKSLDELEKQPVLTGGKGRKRRDAAHETR